jgi:transposase
MKMKRIDGRKLSIEKLQQLRNTAIELYKLGKTYDESVEILGVSKTTIWEWRKAYKDNGSLKPEV